VNYRIARSAILLLALAACGKNTLSPSTHETASGDALDDQAVAVGIMPDPDDVEFAGRFETRSDLGTDKFCAVSNGTQQFNIGFLAVYGPESKCEGTGTATIKGQTVRVVLTGQGSCSFDARYDGIELRFPGTVESGCSTYCSANANLSGTHYFMVQPGDEAARQTLGRDTERLCG